MISSFTWAEKFLKFTKDTKPHKINISVYQLQYEQLKYMYTMNELEYGQSQEGPRRALHKFAGAMLKLYKSRSKFTVKVTCFWIYGTIGKVWT